MVQIILSKRSRSRSPQGLTAIVISLLRSVDDCSKYYLHANWNLRIINAIVTGVSGSMRTAPDMHHVSPLPGVRVRPQVFGPQDAVDFVAKYQDGRSVKAICNRILNEVLVAGISSNAACIESSRFFAVGHGTSCWCMHRHLAMP